MLNIVLATATPLHVEMGSYVFQDLAMCVNSTFCYANNWMTDYVAYGYFAESADYNFGAFHLAANEALVVEFELPPETLYFGMTPYLLNRTSNGTNLELFASLMDTVNMEDITARCGQDYAGSIRFIMSTNLYVTEKMSPSWHSCVIPFNIAGGLLNLGYDKTADWFGLLARCTLFANAIDGQIYLHEANTTVERVTLDVSTEYYGYPELDARPDLLTETHLRPLLFELEDAVLDTMKQAGYTWTDYNLEPFMANISYDSGWAGINNSVNLYGDNRDATYLNTPNSTDAWILKPNDFILAIGVLHADVIKATYNNIQIYDIVNWYGVTGFVNSQMEDTATTFLPEATSLYVLAFSRNCSALPYEGRCASLTETFPHGIPLDHGVFFVERVYSCPPNWRGPSYDSVVPAHMYHFSLR